MSFDKIIIYGLAAGLPLMVGVTFWPTLGIVLFLSTFLLKAQLKQLGLAPGYTLDFMFGAVAIYGALLSMVRSRKQWPNGFKWANGYLGCFLALFVLFLLLFPITRAPQVAVRKLTWMIFALGCVAISAAYLQSYQSLKHLIWGYCFLSIPIGVVSLKLGITTHGSERLTFLGSNPLIVGNFMGIACCFCLGLAIYSNGILNKLWLVAIPVYAMVIFESSSRGSLFAVPLAFVIVNLILGARQTVKSLSLLVLCALASFYFFFQDIHFEETRFSSEAMQGSTIERVDLWRRTLEGALSRLPFIGGGPGDSTYILTGKDEWEGVYPHNPYVEIFSELGLAGLSILSLAAFMVVQSVFRLRAIPRLERKKYDGVFILAIVVIYVLLMGIKSASYASWFEAYFWFSVFLHAYVRFVKDGALSHPAFNKPDIPLMNQLMRTTLLS